MCLQLAVPVAVSTAVRIDTITCIIVFRVSFFITLTCLSPALLRAEGPSAPCAWLASAVRVTLDVSAAKLLHCHCGSRIQPSVSHFSLLTHHFSLLTHHLSLITSHSSLLTHHFSLLTSHLSLLTSHFITSFGHFGHLVICQNRKRMLSKPPL